MADKFVVAVFELGDHAMSEEAVPFVEKGGVKIAVDRTALAKRMASLLIHLPPKGRGGSHRRYGVLYGKVQAPLVKTGEQNLIGWGDHNRGAQSPTTGSPGIVPPCLDELQKGGVHVDVGVTPIRPKDSKGLRL